MKIHPYLNFDGQCEAAMTFYAECLGGQLQLLRFGESPMRDEVPADCHGRIMHACLMVGDQTLMASDTTPQCPSDAIQGCSVTLQVERAEEAERLFAALGAGGTVQMPLQQTFWAVRFGMCTDRFGTPWMVNCSEAPGDSQALASAGRG